MARFTLAGFAILSSAISGVVADICNKDNCLNALAVPSRSAATFCHQYTAMSVWPTYTNTIPVPTYVPTTCSPQRISSACYCVDNAPNNPKYTPPPCPKGNVVANPSFYGQAGAGGVDIRPWVIAAGEGSLCGLVNGYDLASFYGWGDPRAISCGFNQTLGGTSTVSQDLKLCPSQKYHLRLSTANNPYYTGPVYFGNLTFRVLFDHVQILSPRVPSPQCADPSRSDYRGDYCRSSPYYWNNEATFTAPASGKGALVIEVDQPKGLKGFEAPMLLDTIFVNLVGDNTTNDPAGPCCCGAPGCG